jgi:chromosomal replication initiator protein
MIPLAVPPAETSPTAAETPELAGYFRVTAGATAAFVGDDSNPLVRWVIQVLQQPGDNPCFSRLWPLTLVGPAGVGKSILAAGLLLRLNPRGGPSLIQTSVDDLGRSLQSALEVNALADWRTRLDSAPVLLLEHLPRLASLGQLQHQLSDILDARASHDRPTLLTSTEPLVRCGLSDRLLSRLQMGFVLPVSPPGPLALGFLVRQTFESAGLTIAPAQVQLLLAAGLRDPAIIKSLAHRWLLERGRAPFDLALAPVSIHECLGAAVPTPVPPEVVLKVTAKLFQLSVKDLRGSARTSACCRARALAMWVCRQYLKISYQQIGSLFGNRDHSTVLSSCKKMESLLPNDVFLQATLQQLLSRLPQPMELVRP